VGAVAFPAVAIFDSSETGRSILTAADVAAVLAILGISGGGSGSTWYVGSTVPDSGTGINGDFYLRSTNGDVYQKAAGAWAVVANIQGPAGADGSDGAAGPNQISVATSTDLSGLLKGDGANVSAAVSGTDYATPSGVATAVSDHAAAVDPHGDRSYADAAIAALSGTYQPLDSDLTAIAALATSTFGRSLLTQADAATARSTLGAGTSSFDGAFSSLSGKPTTLAGYGIADAQPLDSDLTAIAALTTTAFGRGLLALADASALRIAAGLGGAAVLNVGTAAGTVAAGDDSRLSDARTPTAHASSHASAGGDPIKLDDLAAPDDNTDLNVSTSAHGLVPKAPNLPRQYFNGTAAWSYPVPELTASKTADYTAAAGDWALFDLSAASADVTLTLPATPSVGDRVVVTQTTKHATWKLVVARNGSNVNGGTTMTDFDMTTNGGTCVFTYVGGSAGWSGAVAVVGG